MAFWPLTSSSSFEQDFILNISKIKSSGVNATVHYFSEFYKNLCRIGKLMHVSSRFPQSPSVEPRKYFVKHIWDFERRVVRVKAKRLKEPCRPYCCSVHQWTEKTTESWEMYRKATLMARGGPIEVPTNKIF